MKIPIQLLKESREPFYHQIESQLKTLIVSGHLKPESPLPSIRVLAKDLEVSVITTRRAYQNLENQGFIKTVQGKGTFVDHIDPSLKDDLKTTEVYKNFQQAVEIAIHYQYTFKEIKELIDDVLKEQKNRMKKEDSS